MPLKSQSFYGDTSINDYLNNDFSTFGKNSDFLSENSYGFLTSTSIVSGISNQFSVNLRPILFKSYIFLVYYLVNWYSIINNRIFLNFYFITSVFYFKIDFFVNIIINWLKTTLEYDYFFYFYFFKLIIYSLKGLVSLINYLFLFFIKIETVVTIDSLYFNSDSFFSFFEYFYILLDYFFFNFKLIFFDINFKLISIFFYFFFIYLFLFFLFIFF